MIKRINRHKSIISSIFLTGYFSFIVLTITHFHNEGLNSYNRNIVPAYNISSTTETDSPENCQICHSFSSININTVIITFSSGLLVEDCTLFNDDTIYKSNPVDINYLRGPPNFNILSV
jgi:hypothetical protein